MKKDSAEKILNLLSLDELMRLHTNYETNDDRLYQGFDTGVPGANRRNF